MLFRGCWECKIMCRVGLRQTQWAEALAGHESLAALLSPFGLVFMDGGTAARTDGDIMLMSGR